MMDAEKINDTLAQALGNDEKASKEAAASLVGLVLATGVRMADALERIADAQEAVLAVAEREAGKGVSGEFSPSQR